MQAAGKCLEAFGMVAVILHAVRTRRTLRGRHDDSTEPSLQLIVKNKTVNHTLYTCTERCIAYAWFTIQQRR